MAWSGCDLYSGNIKYYCSYYQFDQIQVCHIYNIYNSLQYNSTSFLSNIEHNYITVIIEVVCQNMFFYDWSNINRYSRTTMQHVTAVKIGGGGAGTIYNEITIQFNIISFQHRTQFHYSDRRSGMSKYLVCSFMTGLI